MSKIRGLSTAILMVLVLLVSGSIPLWAAEQAELTVSGIDATTIYAGVANTVVVNVGNLSSAGADSFALTLEANGIAVGRLTNLSISGKSDPYYWPLAVSFNWTPSAPGSYTLHAVVDSDNSVAETDESNNSADSTVEVNILSPLTAQVRVEGKDTTLWAGEVTFKTSTITDKQGDTHIIDHPTVLGALAEAAQQGDFNYVVSSAWGSLSYIEKIGNDAPSGLNGWLYRVNWNSAGVSAIDYTLAPGAQVLFYYGGWDARPLRLSVDQNEALASQSFNLQVEEFTGTDWIPAADAVVRAGDRSFQADPAGLITGITLSPGHYNLIAVKGSPETYIRSNQESLSLYYPLNLEEGWNFISVPRRLAANQDTVEALFGTVDTASHSVFSYDQQAGWVTLKAADAILPLQGIWIFAAGKTELHPVFDTNPRAAPLTRSLSAGWNAIGFSDFQNCSANSALTSVENQWATLIGFDAASQRYEVSIINNSPEQDSHSEIRELAPWKGYWLFLTADSVLAAISS
jgi:hypothetical protein